MPRHSAVGDADLKWRTRRLTRAGLACAAAFLFPHEGTMATKTLSYQKDAGGDLETTSWPSWLRVEEPGTLPRRGKARMFAVTTRGRSATVAFSAIVVAAPGQAGLR